MHARISVSVSVHSLPTHLYPSQSELYDAGDDDVSVT
jgi:hypothetical protein